MSAAAESAVEQSTAPPTLSPANATTDSNNVALGVADVPQLRRLTAASSSSSTLSTVDSSQSGSRSQHLQVIGPSMVAGGNNAAAGRRTSATTYGPDGQPVVGVALERTISSSVVETGGRTRGDSDTHRRSSLDLSQPQQPALKLTGMITQMHSAPSPFKSGKTVRDTWTPEQHDEWRKLKKEARKRKQKDDASTLMQMGTKITEGHVNFILMYDMLTGIRHAVSRCVAKPHRDLVPADFRARHKLAFDIMGNEMTPSSKYEFKFKDYSPWVFRYIRELFKIEAADYLMSLTGKYVLSELGSPGKSGSFFYFSQDYRFIIKTVHHTEHTFLRSILHYYYEHLKKYPNTLLCRYYGLHRVKLPHGRKIHFVVMGNVEPPNKDIHERFDLKGSLVGRQVSDEELKMNPHVVMKDLNWLKLQRRLMLGPQKAQWFLEQMQLDVQLLMSIYVMDYSLLLGVHYLKRGNSENIRDKSLSVFDPATDTLTRPKSKAVRRAIESSDPTQLGPSRLPDKSPAERQGFTFYQDDGGFRATDDRNQPLGELYHCGIIDILTPYNAVKRAEHYWKSLTYDKDLISAVEPIQYGLRFIEFMTNKVVSLGAGTDAARSQQLDTVAEDDTAAEGSSSNHPAQSTHPSPAAAAASPDKPHHEHKQAGMKRRRFRFPWQVGHGEPDSQQLPRTAVDVKGKGPAVGNDYDLQLETIDKTRQ